jgi:hypothetical protein
MATQTRTQPLVEITDPDCMSGYEEAQLPCFRDCKLRTDLALVEAIRGFLTEIAVEGRLTEQLLRRNTGFLIGILSLE